jgi:hypothetical protein
MSRQTLNFLSLGRGRLRVSLHRACLASLALVLAPTFGQAAEVFWQGPDGNWNTPSAWTLTNPPPGPPSGVPSAAGDQAHVAYGATVTIDANIPSVQAIYIGKDNDFGGSTTGTAILNQTAGDVVLVNGGHDPWMVVGELPEANSTYNLSGGSLSFGGNDDLTIAQGGTGTFNLSGNATVNVPRVQVGRWAAFDGDTPGPSNGTVHQSGNTTFTATRELTVGRQGVGAYTMDSGVLNVLGTAADRGDMSIGRGDGAQANRPATGVFTQNGGTVTVGVSHETGAWLNVGGADTGTGTGTYNMHGGTLNSITRIQIAQGGGSSGTFNQDGGFVTAHTVEVGQGALGTYNISAGTLDTTSKPGGNAVIVGAWDNGNGVLNVSDNGEVITESMRVARSRAEVANRGVVNQTGGIVTATQNFVLGDGNAANNALYVQQGGLVNLGANGLLMGVSNSTGVYRLEGGTLNGNASSLNYAGPGGNFIMTGGELFNTAAANFALNQAGGIVQPGDGVGQMTVNGNYTEALPGSLQIEMAGTGIGTGHDNLAVNGLVTLSGGLDVLLAFAPTLGQTFEVLSNDSIDPIVGSFAGKPQGSTFLTNFSGTPYAFQISYFGANGNDNDVILTSVPVPEPSTIVLGTLGLLGLWGYARRRPRAA